MPVATRKRSVRLRVTILATGIVALVLTVMAGAIVVVQSRSLTAAVDEGLERRAADLAAVVARGVPDSLVGADDDTAAQISTEAGEVLVASANLGATASIGSLAPGLDESTTETWLAGPDDSFRILTRRIDSPHGPVLLHVATATDDISDSVATLRSSMLIAVPLAVGALALAIWWMVGRALQPVEAIRREVDAISETDLGRRVPVPATGDEIERLAVTMNGMLGRLEGGVARLQRFVADASHELRTPLTRIRTELEVDMADPASANLAATQQSALDEVTAMEEMIADLLYLARSDARRPGPPTEPVDLDDLVLAEVQRQRLTASIDIDVADVSGGQVRGDEAQLRRMVANLLGNAVRFAATAVRLTLGEEDESVVLTVADDGPGIDAAEHERIFERFARGDESRSRDDGGTGLGLAIARDVADRHRGSISVDPGYRAGAKFVVRLPRSPS